MPKFRKKPVEIEAFRFTGRKDYPAWFRLHPMSRDYGDFAEINTLEGTMIVEIGDWVILGVKSEIYPCKDDIFQMTYEPV